MTQPARPVVLVILDGWGLSDRIEGTVDLVRSTGCCLCGKSTARNAHALARTV
jgi:bisphosphoglycerate-independent phosphoglycerate mutase (AlkP superfamily)